jgi:hypothetical protein
MAFEPFVPPAKGWAPETAGLTHSQLIGIASVVSAWAVLEGVLQNVLVVLTQAPLALGQALTEDLGPDNRLKALKRLCQSWEIAAGGRYPEHMPALASVAAVGTWVEKNKGRRNQIAHWQWLRQTDDEVLGFKYSMRIGSPEKPSSGSFLTAKTTDFSVFAEEIRLQTEKMINLLEPLEKLPAWPRN